MGKLAPALLQVQGGHGLAFKKKKASIWLLMLKIVVMIVKMLSHHVQELDNNDNSMNGSLSDII